MESRNARGVAVADDLTAVVYCQRLARAAAERKIDDAKERARRGYGFDARRHEDRQCYHTSLPEQATGAGDGRTANAAWNL
jgi:hypothetical protein